MDKAHISPLDSQLVNPLPRMLEQLKAEKVMCEELSAYSRDLIEVEKLAFSHY